MGQLAISYGISHFSASADVLSAIEYDIFAWADMLLAIEYDIFAWADMLPAMEYYILLHGPTCY
jgi:hypothetical protein